MKRLVIAVAAASAALPVAIAHADEEIVAATPNRFTATEVTIDQGERLTFRNTDFASHDVTHDDNARLFASDTIGQGTSEVKGAQHLTTGSYPFFCTVHPSMKGTLTVTSAGQPLPRPGTGSGPGAPPPPQDTTAPTFTLKAARTYKASSLKRAQAVKFTLGSDEGATVALTVKIGSLKAGTLEVEFGSAGSRRVEVFLSARGRRALKRGRKLSIAARGSDTAGNEAKASYSTRLR